MSSPDAPEPAGKTYLGDGVYVAWTAQGIVLTAENGAEVLERIVLEPDVWWRLRRWVQRRDAETADEPSWNAADVRARRRLDENGGD